MSKVSRKVVILIAAGVLAISACSGDDDDNPGVITDPPRSSTTSESTSTTEPTTTTDPDAELKADVEAAYLAAWEADLRIFGDPDPSNPLIKQHYINGSLESVLDTVSQHVLEGRAIRAPDDPADLDVAVTTIAIVDSQTARLQACVLDGLVLFEVEGGRVIDDEIVTKRKTVQMRKHSGLWKIAMVSTENVEGNPGCDG